MEVFNIHGIIHPVFDPKCLFVCLAFRAIPVTATVIAVAFTIATITLINVSTQGRCPAFVHSVERTLAKAIGLALLNILSSKPIDDMGNFKLWTLHYF